jgi:hypothetical protein
MNLSKIIQLLPGTDSVPYYPDDLQRTLKENEQKLSGLEGGQKRCSSDYSYWGYVVDINYYNGIVNILKAAKILGVDNMPNIPVPQEYDGYKDNIKAYGNAVFKIAKAGCTHKSIQLVSVIERVTYMEHNGEKYVGDKFDDMDAKPTMIICNLCRKEIKPKKFGF